jgi:hypothetical protein
MELPKEKRQPISAVAKYVISKTDAPLADVKDWLGKRWINGDIAIYGNPPDGAGGFDAAAPVEPSVLPDREIDWGRGIMVWPRLGRRIVVMANLSCEMDEIDRWLSGPVKASHPTGHDRGDEDTNDDGKRRKRKWADAEAKVRAQVGFLLEKRGPQWFEGKKPKDLEAEIRQLLSRSMTKLPDRRLMQQWIRASATKHGLPIGREAKRQQPITK